jgi:type IV pilus assembly protein PilZ
MADASQGREHARKPIELEVTYKRLNAFFSDYTKNISKGGTFIRTEKPLDVGTEFLFKLHVPRLPEPLCIVGQVQWVRTQQDADAGPGAGAGPGAEAGSGAEAAEKMPGMGIRFIYRDEAERAAVERQIERIMVDSLGQRLYSRLMELSHGNEAGGDDESWSGAYQGLGGQPPRNRES